MPPKAPPGKNVPTQGSQQKSSPTRGAKGRAGKKPKEKKKRHVLNLKGWLETKADWEKFDAWAKINAEPRKIPEPEPVVRLSKPLSKMKKRIASLSRPSKRPDGSKLYRYDMSVSRKALKAKPSKRIKQLSKFVLREIESSREVPVKVPSAVLRYEPTKRIIEISRPQGIHYSAYCKSLATSQDSAPSKKITDRTNRLALAKKAVQCPHLMTDEEIDLLLTPMGVYRSALSYEVTPWMNYLALPSYRSLKEQTDEKAEEWKKLIVDEAEMRGKKALEHKKKKAERAKKLEEKKDVAKAGEQQKPSDAVADEDKDNEKEDVVPEEVPEEQADETNEPGGGTDDSAQDPAMSYEKNNESGDTSTKNEETAEEAEAAKRRKAERNAWRFAPPPYADNPFELKRSALKGKVSPRVAELAKPQIHQDRNYKKKPFDVRKSALTGPVPERMAELAKPSNPRDPVERPPPREKDEFGRPIFPKQPYGKRMPRMKPYEEGECPKKDDGEGKKEEESEET